MDPITNPYAPGAGSPPPCLAGRDALLDEARILLARFASGRTAKCLWLSGLRGVGKTTLLTAIEELALTMQCRTITLEAVDGKPLAALLAPPLRQLLFALERDTGASPRIGRALAVLRSFLAVRGRGRGLDQDLTVAAERGTADSGDLEADLAELLLIVGEAVREHRAAAVLLLDEIHALDPREHGALILAVHRLQQRQLPLTLIGAGLPILPMLADQPKSYAERLCHFTRIGNLAEADSIRALGEPAARAGVQFAENAAIECHRLTGGHPYLLQLWAHEAWLVATGTRIGIADIRAAADAFARRVDLEFFGVYYDRLTAAERIFLRAMAELGSGPQRTGDIARELGLSVNGIGPVRARLMKKAVVYSPGHGQMAGTIPLFDAYLKRALPGWRSPTTAGSSSGSSGSGSRGGGGDGPTGGAGPGPGRSGSTGIGRSGSTGTGRSGSTGGRRDGSADDGDPDDGDGQGGDAGDNRRGGDEGARSASGNENRSGGTSGGTSGGASGNDRASGNGTSGNGTSGSGTSRCHGAGYGSTNPNANANANASDDRDPARRADVLRCRDARRGSAPAGQPVAVAPGRASVEAAR